MINKVKVYKCNKCGKEVEMINKPLPYKQCRNPFTICNGEMKLTETRMFEVDYGK